jgi:two-component system sensor kinase FixL
VREAAELATVGSRHQAIDVTFEFSDDLPEIMIDRVQIQQVVMNLVRNSVEALADADKRSLTLRTTRPEKAKLQIDVVDTGPGLPKEITERLFQPFLTTKAGGIGIGLSICKTIVDSHGGHLWTTPNPGGGTAFHISLPIDLDETTAHG